MMNFPPLFQISPLFLKIFRTFWKFFTILPFPEKFLDLHPPKFLMTFFFSHRPQISNFPSYFRCFSTFSPLFREHFSFPPTFTNFPPCFRQIHLLFTYFTCIFPPYFDHDAFMHHPMHVLDAPGQKGWTQCCSLLLEVV